jgi:hypothetical protein
MEDSNIIYEVRPPLAACLNGPCERVLPPGFRDRVFTISAIKLLVFDQSVNGPRHLGRTRRIGFTPEIRVRRIRSQVTTELLPEGVFLHVRSTSCCHPQS